MTAGAAIVLGLVNVFADGVSMAVGNYFKARSEQELRYRERVQNAANITAAGALPLDTTPSPVLSGGVAFFGFVAAGLLALSPLMLSNAFEREVVFVSSGVISAAILIGIGIIRGLATGRPIMRCSGEMLTIAGLAALLAFFVGSVLRDYVHL